MNKTGTLYIVGMPIGSQSDVSKRMTDVIENQKRIVVEQARIFRFTCDQLGIKLRDDVELIEIKYESGKNFENFHKDRLIDLLKNGEDLYVVSDEGMPGIADPGTKLIQSAIKENIRVTSSPGPSSIMAAITVAGVEGGFSFEGFMSHEEERRPSEWQNHKTKLKPMVFLVMNRESNSHPMEKSIFSEHMITFLKEAVQYLGEDREAVLCYNLTQHNEQVIRGKLIDLLNMTNENRIDGNCSIVIAGTNGLFR